MKKKYVTTGDPEYVLDRPYTIYEDSVALLQHHYSLDKLEELEKLKEEIKKDNAKTN